VNFSCEHSKQNMYWNIGSNNSSTSNIISNNSKNRKYKKLSTAITAATWAGTIKISNNCNKNLEIILRLFFLVSQPIASGNVERCLKQVVGSCEVEKFSFCQTINLEIFFDLQHLKRAIRKLRHLLAKCNIQID